MPNNTAYAVTMLLICVGVILTSLYFGLRPLRRTPAQKAEGRPMSYNTRLTRRQRVGIGVAAGAGGYAASAGSSVARGALFIAAFAFLGQCVGGLIVSCQKYLTPEEFDAVKEADRWLERHGAK
ncbi:hypothetical protein [Gordonia hankookensis]|uniref:Uncharacterized protein n=1 Tax=Gordonia hankookensis TaxID=589403 RepID=A0ABR7WDY4_9ACTN|nr:hypothetical protein [Gordonia hankookensis]MBD1320608.1 hypothetical protein [Gordonia hankookensis]